MTKTTRTLVLRRSPLKHVYKLLSINSPKTKSACMCLGKEKRDKVNKCRKMLIIYKLRCRLSEKGKRAQILGFVVTHIS